MFNVLERQRRTSCRNMLGSKGGRLLFGFILVLFALLASAAVEVEPSHYSMPFNRTSFPPGFIFGAGLAAYQSEGAALVHGRGPSIWDTFTREHPEKISDGSNGNVANDFYNHYKEDIKLIKKIGLDSFRFSFSWSRILPSKIIDASMDFHYTAQNLTKLLTTLKKL